MQRGRAGVQRHGVAGADIRGKRPFEVPHSRAGRQPAGAQRGHDLVDFRLPDRRRRERHGSHVGDRHQCRASETERTRHAPTLEARGDRAPGAPPSRWRRVRAPSTPSTSRNGARQSSPLGGHGTVSSPSTVKRGDPRAVEIEELHAPVAVVGNGEPHGVGAVAGQLLAGERRAARTSRPAACRVDRRAAAAAECADGPSGLVGHEHDMVTRRIAAVGQVPARCRERDRPHSRARDVRSGSSCRAPVRE